MPGMATDLDQVPLVISGLLGGMFAQLFLLAAIDPQADKNRPAQPKSTPPRSDK